MNLVLLVTLLPKYKKQDINPFEVMSL